MNEPAPLKRKLDALYRGPPEDFVAGRNDLAKQLKADGDAEASKQVKALRKPSVAAALLNRVALGHPKELKAYATAVGKLRKASGKATGDALKSAAKAERDAAAKLLVLAEDEGGEGATLDRVAETIQAAAADEEVEDLLVRGRLEKERRGASIGFGLAVDDGDDDEPAAKKKTKAEPKPTKRTATERKREQQAEKKLKQAREREAKKVEKARKDLESAVHDQQQADEEVNAAKDALAEAKESLKQAKEAAGTAASAVTEAKQQFRDRERELADLD